jgi:hypothetical protein
VTCAELANGGVAIGVRNQTAINQPLHLTLSKLKGASGNVPGSEVCGGLSISRLAKLAPAEEKSVLLSAGKPNSATFTGSLALFAASGKAERREISIGPPSQPAGLAAAPLLGEISESLKGSATGPISIPVEGPSGDLPPDRDEDSDPLTLGAVAGPNGAASVVYAGRKRLDEATALAEVKLADGLSPGTYKGSIDLNPVDPEKGSVSLEVKVAERLWVAIALLIAGIVVGLVIQSWAARRLPRARTLKRIAALGPLYDAAIKDLEREAGTAPWARFRIKALDAVMIDLGQQLDRATKKVVIQANAAVFEDVETAIGNAELQIGTLKVLGELAGELEATLGALAESRVPPPAPGEAERERPQLLSEALKAIAGEPLSPVDLEKRADQIRTRITQVEEFRTLGLRLGRLREERGRLGEDEERFKSIDGKLDGAHHLLQVADGPEGLAAAAKFLGEAEGLIAEQMNEQGSSFRRGVRIGGPVYAERAMHMFTAAVGIGEGLEQIPAYLGPRKLAKPARTTEPRFDENAAKRELNRAFLGQLCVVALAAIVAVATGLGALYAPNDTWGSCWDLVSIALWGLVAQTVLTTLATSIDGLAALGFSRRDRL